MFPTLPADVAPSASDPAAPQRRYRTHCEEVWQAARADYAEGWSAQDVCLRYDLGLSALRTRARNEGWRRADLADEEPVRPSGGEPDEALPLMELVELAWRRASEAVVRGKVYEARVWMRLTGELREQIKSEASDAERRESLPTVNAERAAKGWPLLTAALHPLHSISKVQTGAGSPPTSPPPVQQLQHQHDPGEEQADGVGGDQGPAFQPDPVGDPQGETRHGGEVHPQGNRRSVPLSPNLNHLGRETGHGEQGGGDAKADDEDVHRPLTAPDARGCGGD